MAFKPLPAALMIACLPAAALAQTAPSRVIPQTRPDQTPPPAHQKMQPAPAQPDATAAAPLVRPFVLKAVAVEGSSLPPARIEAAYRPFLGRTVGVGELQQISDAVARAYEASDVALYTVLIPDQDFADGRLNLVAIEGYVEAATLDAPVGRRNRSLVQAYLDSLKRERPLTKRKLQRKVSLVRDIPGLASDIQLASGGRQGAVQVNARLKPRRFQAGIGINNRGTAFLGRTQVQADLYANSLIRQGDQTRLTYATPTQTRLFQYYAASHLQPLNANGTTVQASAGRLRTRPKDTGLLGHATTAGIQVTHPVIRSFDQDLYATLGLDGLDSDNAFLGFTFSDDRTRALRASLAYSRTSRKGLMGVSLALSRGIDGLGARVTDPAAGKLDFTKVNGRVTFNRSLAEPLILRLSGAGQYSGDRLPAAEHFALGGEDFGRAFEASYVAGDYGYGLSAELAFRPDLPQKVSGSEVYGFVDGGRVWYRSRFGDPTFDADLSSAGAGVRMIYESRAILQLEAAKGLSNPVPFLDRDDWRGVFNLRSLF